VKPFWSIRNIFIDLFRNHDAKLRKLIDGFERTCINTIIYFELVRGEPNKKRYAAMEAYLGKYDLLHLDNSVCERAMDRMRDFRLSDGLDFPDALIASTCIEHDLYLYSKNRRHFRFIPDLKVI